MMVAGNKGIRLECKYTWLDKIRNGVLWDIEGVAPYNE